MPYQQWRIDSNSNPNDIWVVVASFIGYMFPCSCLYGSIFCLFIIHIKDFFLTSSGKDIPFDKDSLIPAGDVGYALAWTYALNYLQFVLKGEYQSKLLHSIMLNT